MLKDEAKEMFAKYRALEKHFDEQKDSKGFELFLEVLKSSSKVVTALVEYNNIMVQYCNEVKELVENEQ